MLSALEAVSSATNSTTSITNNLANSTLGSVTGNSSEAAKVPFADLMTDSVAQVNQLEATARTTVDGLMTGSGVDVHQAMIATEKASMAFELALSVRNKAVAAYQSVMGMQF